MRNISWQMWHLSHINIQQLEVCSCYQGRKLGLLSSISLRNVNIGLSILLWCLFFSLITESNRKTLLSIALIHHVSKTSNTSLLEYIPCLNTVQINGKQYCCLSSASTPCYRGPGGCRVCLSLYCWVSPSCRQTPWTSCRRARYSPFLAAQISKT